MIFPSTVAGSLPKPAWLAEPNKLWPQWRLQGDELAAAKLDATLLAIKWQEDAGIDIVCDGEMSRQHFVHGFLEFVDGIDFAHKVEMGIRKDRYKAMVPQVVAPLRLKGRVHADEARVARSHTRHQLKFTLPGPMTIIDTVADGHYGDRVKMAFAFAEQQGRYNLADLTTTAKKQGAAYMLNGQKAVVVGAPWADQLIVTARTADQASQLAASVTKALSTYVLGDPARFRPVTVVETDAPESGAVAIVPGR